MTIACISDLHGNLPIYPSDYWKGLEECELLLICGDILPLRIQFDMPASRKWLIEEFKPWAAELPVEQVYFIAGNHDDFAERNDRIMHEIFSRHDKVTYLMHEYVDYLSSQDSKVYRIFGTPYCHIFGDWAFMRSEETLAKKFREIPGNVDILISHDSPKIGKIGTILQESQFNSGIDAGNEVLAKYIMEKKPRYVFSGHIHTGQHEILDYNGIKLANCSILNEKYNLVYKPLIIRI